MHRPICCSPGLFIKTHQCPQMNTKIMKNSEHLFWRVTGLWTSFQMFWTIQLFDSRCCFSSCVNSHNEGIKPSSSLFFQPWLPRLSQSLLSLPPGTRLSKLTPSLLLITTSYCFPKKNSMCSDRSYWKSYQRTDHQEREFTDRGSPGLTDLTDNNTQRKQPLYHTSSHGSCFEASTLQLWTLKSQTIQFCENNLALHRGKHPLSRVQTISNGIIFLRHQLPHCLITDAVLKFHDFTRGSYFCTRLYCMNPVVQYDLQPESISAEKKRGNTAPDFLSHGDLVVMYCLSSGIIFYNYMLTNKQIIRAWRRTFTKQSLHCKCIECGFRGNMKPTAHCWEQKLQGFK